MLADSIVSPLGSTTEENFDKVKAGISGLKLVDDPALSGQPFFGARIDNLDVKESKFETLCRQVIEQLLSKVSVDRDRTVLILSTTKGNISFIEAGRADHQRLHLHAAASYLGDAFGLKNALVVSNACISGVMALIVGKRLIQSGQYDHAIVVGADVLSRFVISGFQSLQALSPEACKPFDERRKGINLGECAAGVVLGSNEIDSVSGVYIAGTGLSNDANHISGPSRTGEELAFAVNDALEEAGMTSDDVDFISAHGTATLYNDEMEAKAMHLANMEDKPLNSLKGYFGHTLGAAGVVETILSSESLKRNQLLPTAGFESIGVSQPVNVIKNTTDKKVTTCLKTASGFGGCNAAIILKKELKSKS
jgi:3-oxoacyl-[acyl-carrier-protein] synthase-1